MAKATIAPSNALHFYTYPHYAYYHILRYLIIFDKNQALGENVGNCFANLKNIAIFAPQLRKALQSGCSAVRLAHLLWEQGVPSSNLGTPTERLDYNQAFFVDLRQSRCFGISEISEAADFPG